MEIKYKKQACILLAVMESLEWIVLLGYVDTGWYHWGEVGRQKGERKLLEFRSCTYLHTSYQIAILGGVF